MSTIFSKIISGEIPSYKIAENQYCFAFLDINPLQKGHVLVVPKLEVDEVFELPESNYIELFKFSQSIAQAIKKAIPCLRVGSAIVGLEVPHAHVHLIPISKMEDMNFANKKLEFTRTEFEETARLIQKEL